MQDGEGDDGGERAEDWEVKNEGEGLQDESSFSGSQEGPLQSANRSRELNPFFLKHLELFNLVFYLIVSFS